MIIIVPYYSCVTLLHKPSYISFRTTTEESLNNCVAAAPQGFLSLRLTAGSGGFVAICLAVDLVPESHSEDLLARTILVLIVSA